jgi:hypothetical protein
VSCYQENDPPKEQRMKPLLTAMAVGAAMMACVNAFAQAPAGATALCKDGSYYSNASKKGACSRHGGVKDWYGENAPKTAPSATTPPDKNTAVLVPDKAAPSVARTTAAAGGGPGQVWVNTRSKVYHCQGNKWYGKTKAGEYMTEAAAKAAGSHADHGKACT